MRNNNTLSSVSHEDFTLPSQETQAADFGQWEQELNPLTSEVTDSPESTAEQSNPIADTFVKQENRLSEIMKAGAARREVAKATEQSALLTAENTANAAAVLENLNNAIGGKVIATSEAPQPTNPTPVEQITIPGQAEKMSLKFGPMMQERARVAREANQARSVEAQAPEEPSGRHSEAPGRVSFAETMANAQLENRESPPSTATEVIRSIGTAAANPETITETPSIRALEAIKASTAEARTEKLKLGERLTARADKIPDGMPAIKEAIAEKGGLKGILKKAWMKATFRSDARRAKRLDNKESRLSKKQDKINEKLTAVEYEKAFQAKKAEEREKERQVLVDKSRVASAAKQQRKQNRQAFRQENYNNIRQSVSESKIGRVTANTARKSNQYIKGEKIQKKPTLSPEERAARMAEIAE
ncbi:hypothetical protein A2707_06040 [Candidatus Saccharibacteria bacterium RIFCSPHIGHO2_01_FULL_45_15]|nr:MAG: hypothetical protein A2707_06040 [Candidatus Saccharibacteria bacterium RIFCSPHIGHO2_01_FULL_45_15]OGL27568.1 MAG: hypothetical protein A3C39_04695 [Candidatus Saccharibacteria bacterium RIFCSPHIGHO2_02_FULL_46_12]OGL32020.1 MAG: hypothetical protein A3E76_01985 [Candidatus Saccharibacteria bacterium RIFCSPHIGHO2_12_FULL_44_22]